jgi:hypothetical protein
VGNIGILAYPKTNVQNIIILVIIIYAWKIERRTKIIFGFKVFAIVLHILGALEAFEKISRKYKSLPARYELMTR